MTGAINIKFSKTHGAEKWSDVEHKILPAMDCSAESRSGLLEGTSKAALCSPHHNARWI